MKFLSLVFSVTLFLLGTISTHSFAQGCEDCPASSNLLANGDFSLGDVGFSSDINFVDACAWSSYDVGNEGRDKCNNINWFDDNWDNTVGTSAGSYMIIDGPLNAGDFAPNRIWYQTVSVTAGEVYDFCFHVLPNISNVTRDLELAYYVDGTNVSGDLSISPGTSWIGYNFLWTATSSGPVEIQIRQVNNFGIGGFDYGLDDMYFGTCSNPCQISAYWNWYQNPQDCSINFNDLSTAGPGTTIIGYYWEFGDGSSSTEMNPVHYYEELGVYEVCLTVYSVNEDGECCTSKICGFVTNDCPPQPCEVNILNIFPSSLPGGDGCDLLFSVLAAPNRTVVGYFWNFGDGATGTGPTPSHSYDASGTYTVCVTIVLQDGEDCCSETFCREIPVSCTTTENTLIGDEPSERLSTSADTPANISLFPNPSNSETKLQFDSKLIQEYQIQLFHLDGKLINKINGTTSQGINQKIIDTQSLVPGTYILQLRLNNQVYTEKLLAH